MVTAVAASFAIVLAAPALVASATAQTAKDILTIDAPNDAATLDPHLQWDTDSYGVYRNIFDNLITRDTAGKIVPQIATAWKLIDDLKHEVPIWKHQTFSDGSEEWVGAC